MRYLGVDPGGKRVGLAIGDSDTGVVSPLATLAYRGLEPLAKELAERAAALGAGCVVIGLPTRQDGSLTPACRRSQRLAEAVRTHGLEVVLQAEYLTTDEARRRAAEIGLSPRTPIDHLAAQVLLEEYLVTS